VIQQSTARVLHAERLPGEMALLVLDAPGIAAVARSGQFVMVRCGDLPLRRPLSIHAADDGKIALLFRVTGSGTGLLSGTEVGGEVQLTGPLGNGYSLPDSYHRAVLIAGGMGIAPLYFLAARLPEPRQATLVYGARSESELYRAPAALRTLLPQMARVDGVETVVATDDGSTGVCGSALDVALPRLEWATHVYLCGPVGMCVAASGLMAQQSDIMTHPRPSVCSPEARQLLSAAEVSLEVRMGCGVGACYSCSIATRSGRKKVCADGPVFRFGDVCWEEVRT